MESERAFPPPGFPISLNTYYKTNPHSWKDSQRKSCEHEDYRDLISKRIILQRRFPRLDIGLHLNPMPSSKQETCNFMRLTDQSFLKTRSISPHKTAVFKPCNFQEAKSQISRRASSFEGNPYYDQHDLSHKEYQESLRKRINGEFKPSLKGSYLVDNNAFLNSKNTFETFTAVSGSPSASMKSGSPVRKSRNK